jgi:hypothetical protein
LPGLPPFGNRSLSKDDKSWEEEEEVSKIICTRVMISASSAVSFSLKGIALGIASSG